jgi:hypothetical protein
MKIIEDNREWSKGKDFEVVASFKRLSYIRLWKEQNYGPEH